MQLEHDGISDRFRSLYCLFGGRRHGCCCEGQAIDFKYLLGFMFSEDDTVLGHSGGSNASNIPWAVLREVPGEFRSLINGAQTRAITPHVGQTAGCGIRIVEGGNSS